MSNEVRRGFWRINLRRVHCPRCGLTMPFLRLPDSLRQLFFGGWTCRQCGCRMSRGGKAL